MIVGVTGTIGSGKSFVSSLFESKGFLLINLDLLYRRLIKPDADLYKKLKTEFGTSIIRKNKSICRVELKKIIFSDPKKLQLLNSITHPFILKETKKIIAANKGTNIVIDAPLLFEARFDSLCDCTVAVVCKTAVQMRRLKSRGKHSVAEVKHILNSQWSQAAKRKNADFVVDNSSSRRETAAQVQKILRKLQ